MDVSNQCRVCLAKCNDGQLESMLISSSESINLWAMYEYIMNIGGIIDSVNVPHVCKTCKVNLKSAYHFKVMCMKTEQTLNENAKTYRTDNETETEYVAFDSDENVVQYAVDYIDENVESDGNIDVDVLDDNDKIREDSPVENTVESDVDEYLKKNDYMDEIETVRQIDDGLITTKESIRVCKKCNVKFKSVKEYRAHYGQVHRTLRKSNALSCLPCNIQFENVRLYGFHYREFHKRSIPYVQPKELCTHCGRLFTKSFIGKHIQSKHPGDHKKEHVCTTCGKVFPLFDNLIVHQRIHTNEKRFECNVCGVKFLHWATRRNHIRSKHTGEMNYECHLCGEKFAYPSNLYQHIRRHRNEKPHQCGACPKAFSTKPELRNHQIVHTKVKNEVCEICSKCFGTRKYLRAHMKVHTGERNHACTVCEKRFTQAHVLRTHLKTHADVEMPEPNVLKVEKIGN